MCGIHEIPCLFYTALRQLFSLVQSRHSSARIASVLPRFSPAMQCGSIPQFESLWLAYFSISGRPKQATGIHMNRDFLMPTNRELSRIVDCRKDTGCVESGHGFWLTPDSHAGHGCNLTLLSHKGR